ncbi:MAG: dTMP kinase [Planctomycetes bacterium]|nr:dTMP kinase [Planctomycetota bacterium]
MPTSPQDTEPRGRLVVLDGPEGSGKSTQVARLEAHLQRAGRSVAVFRDPGGTPAGERIRALLLDPGMGPVDPLTEILLFLASRAQLLAEKVRPALARGERVLLDRFHYSTVAYQVHGLGEGKLPPATLELIRGVNGGLEPDRVVLLDVPPEVGMARLAGARDRIERRDLAFHTRVRRGFLAQAEADPGRIRVVDATAPAREVFRRILAEVGDVL